MKRPIISIIFFLFGALAMIIMSAHYFMYDNSGILGGKAIKDSWWYQIVFLTHIGGGLMAISIGPFQFLERLLKNRPQLHRKIGYCYTLAVASSSITGLVIAQFAMGGIITRVGFSMLSLLWFASLYMGISRAIMGNIVAHQRWMQVNYALTFSSITQRTILLFAFIPAFDFMPVYQASAWFSWMFNLGFILILINQKTKKYAY